jgi:phosphatidylglycerol---prolipoprotein diacylglyceryl transferase
VHPLLFQVGSFSVYTYGVLVATGVLVGVWLAAHDAPRFGLPPQKIWNLCVYGILAALVFSKAWLILSDFSYYVANPSEIFSLTMLESAGTFYGGLLGGILWTIYYTRQEKLPLLATFDVCAAPLALGHAIGRVGCFMAGCCFGKPTSLPWGVTFTSEISTRLAGTPLNVPLHPTQLYAAAAEFINFVLIFLLARSERQVTRLPGQLIGAYLVLYGIERGLLEFLRADPGRTPLFHGTVTLMQLVSVAMVLSGAMLWSRSIRTPNTAIAS